MQSQVDPTFYRSPGEAIAAPPERLAYVAAYDRAVKAKDAMAVIDVDAARVRMLADGYAGLSTRKVAEEAGVPLSQLHYHFGSKGGLILALFAMENEQRLARQTRMYAEDRPLWQRYEQACDFLEDDLESGYVRVLQEMLAAGWSNPEIGDVVRDLLSRWYVLLAEVAREAERRHGPLGPFTAEELATLLGAAFFGKLFPSPVRLRARQAPCLVARWNWGAPGHVPTAQRPGGSRAGCTGYQNVV